MNTAPALTEFDSRISWLEQKVRYDLSAKVDAMNWGMSQLYKSNEATRLDLAALRTGISHLETSAHTDTAELKAAFDERVSELGQTLGSAEASMQHDLGRFREDVAERYDAVRRQLERMDRQLAGIDTKLDRLLARGNASSD